MDTYQKEQSIKSLQRILQDLEDLPLCERMAACREYLACERLSDAEINRQIKAAFIGLYN